MSGILGLKTARNTALCKLNLRMNGTDNGTTFTDSSPSGKTVTRYNALTKTAVKKFGTASGYFDGTGDYLRLDDNVDWFFSNSPFTIELWVNFASSPTGQNKTIISQVQQASAYYITFRLGTGTTTLNLNGESKVNSVTVINSYAYSGTIDTAIWHHIAIVRYGNYLNYYLNGIKIGYTTPAIAFGNFTGYFFIGALNWGSPTQYYYGYMDDFRITKGRALYTRNFKVPTRAA